MFRIDLYVKLIGKYWKILGIFGISGLRMVTPRSCRVPREQSYGINSRLMRFISCFDFAGLEVEQQTSEPDDVSIDSEVVEQYIAKQIRPKTYVLRHKGFTPYSEVVSGLVMHIAVDGFLRNVQPFAFVFRF